MYKVIKQWGEGVTGVVGPEVGDIVDLDYEEAQARVERGEVEVYEDKRVDTKRAPKRTVRRSK